MPLPHVDTWLFDLDNTLYPAASGLFDQVDRRMGTFIAGRLGCDFTAARVHQKGFWQRHGTTLRGLMEEHGVRPEEFLSFVHDIDLTDLEPDPALVAAIDALPGRRLIFTNGSVPHAERILEKVGLAGRFEAVFDIVAAEYVPKPRPEPYAEVVRRFGLRPDRTAMVEDSARNLPPAAALGMTTIWVPPHETADAGEARDHIHHVAPDLAVFLGATR